MRSFKWLTLLFVAACSVAASAANPLLLNLKAVPLTNGWQLTGTITTDGTIGQLGPANILDWNLKLVQTTDTVWTEKDSNDLNISQCTTDGAYILVPTFPNQFQDGGTLFVGRGGGGGRIPTNAVVADFTQLSLNLGYPGGMAGWQDELAGLNYVGLNQKKGILYKAAAAVPGQPNVFRIRVPQITPPPYQITMFGTITTDGTIGALLPPNLIAWNITARTQEIATYTPATTQVMSILGVTYDGTALLVAHTGGQFQIGIPGARPTFVTLADFTDPARPNGFANYYVGNYGVMGEKTPLVNNNAKYYGVAK